MKNKSPSSEVPLFFRQSRKRNKCQKNKKPPKRCLSKTKKNYIQGLDIACFQNSSPRAELSPPSPDVCWATSKCPCHAARCNAVRPAALGAETLLRPQRRCAVVPWPWRAARCKAVEPLKSGSSSAPPHHRFFKWGEMEAPFLMA